MKLITLAAFFLLAADAFAKDKPPIVWEEARITAQTQDTAQGGIATLPIGTGIFTVPITRRTNTIDIETDRYVCQWVEDLTKSKTFLVLPVGETIRFYRDKNWFILMDHNHKKHYFTLTSQRLKTAQ